jgi:hypothetical protein
MTDANEDQGQKILGLSRGWWLVIIGLLVVGYFMRGGDNEATAKYEGTYIHSASDITYELIAKDGTFYGSATDRLGQSVLTYNGKISGKELIFSDNPNLSGTIDFDKAVINIKVPMGSGSHTIVLYK